MNHISSGTVAERPARSTTRRSQTYSVQESGPRGVDVHVGQRLRQRRNLLGLNQDDLAKAIGITYQQVQKYECGTNRISASRLYDAARALKVPVSFFFDGLDATGDDDAGTVLTNEELELIVVLRRAKGAIAPLTYAVRQLTKGA